MKEVLHRACGIEDLRNLSICYEFRLLKDGDPDFLNEVRGEKSNAGCPWNDYATFGGWSVIEDSWQRNFSVSIDSLISFMVLS